MFCVAMLIQTLFIQAVLGFKSLDYTNIKLKRTSSLKSIVPKSSVNDRSNLVSSAVKNLLVPGAFLATTLLVNRAVWGKDNGSEDFDPLVQGILDFSGMTVNPKDGNNFLIQVYDLSVPESPILLAGAKLKYDKSVSLPFRFQLFKENLLVSEKKWNEKGEFDQRVIVSLCEGPIEKGGIIKGRILGKGEGISRVVSIGQSTADERGVRLFAFVKIKPVNI
jgi:hypothetical protein